MRCSAVLLLSVLYSSALAAPSFTDSATSTTNSTGPRAEAIRAGLERGMPQHMLDDYLAQTEQHPSYLAMQARARRDPKNANNIESAFSDSISEKCINRTTVANGMAIWAYARVGYCARSANENCGCSQPTVAGGVSCDASMQSTSLRCDCSGFVSAMLRPGQSQWSSMTDWTALPARKLAKEVSSLSEMQVGDFLIRDGGHHIVMFNSFDGTNIHITEEPGCDGPGAHYCHQRSINAAYYISHGDEGKGMVPYTLGNPCT